MSSESTILRNPSRTPSRPFGISCAIVAILLATATASPGQTLTTLFSFDGTNGAGPGPAPVQGPDGNFYGTTSDGGSGATVYRITPAGDLKTLYSFCPRLQCTDASAPDTSLVLGTDGNFYGTTSGGGANDAGSVFKITTAGKLTTLYSFCSMPDCADGAGPDALLQANDGSFYGTTEGGGPFESSSSNIFKITPAGEFTVLHTFTFCPDCSNASHPNGIIQGTDGNFYGTTYSGGAFLGGTVFGMTRAGKFAILYNFCSLPNCADGTGPEGVIEGTDGNLYGTTDGTGGGTVFQLTPKGQFTTIYTFCSEPNCPDGGGPWGLIQASDGNFYGSTQSGGNTDCYTNLACGTLFDITPSGSLTTLYDFCSQANCPDGNNPHGGLSQSTSGDFYGTTFEGGSPACPITGGCGTVFSLSTGLEPFVAFVHAAGEVGSRAEILGQGFTGTTAVSFNGTSASFEVLSDTSLIAAVPSGAITGPVTVVTSNGTLTSNVPFQILP